MIYWVSPCHTLALHNQMNCFLGFLKLDCLMYIFLKALMTACFIVGFYVHKNMRDLVQAQFRGVWVFPSHGRHSTWVLCWVNNLAIFRFSDYKMRMIMLTESRWLNYWWSLAELYLCLSGIFNNLLKAKLNSPPSYSALYLFFK